MASTSHVYVWGTLKRCRKRCWEMQGCYKKEGFRVSLCNYYCEVSEWSIYYLRKPAKCVLSKLNKVGVSTWFYSSLGSVWGTEGPKLASRRGLFDKFRLLNTPSAPTGEQSPITGCRLQTFKLTSVECKAETLNNSSICGQKTIDNHFHNSVTIKTVL